MQGGWLKDEVGIKEEQPISRGRIRSICSIRSIRSIGSMGSMGTLLACPGFTHPAIGQGFDINDTGAKFGRDTGGVVSGSIIDDDGLEGL